MQTDLTKESKETLSRFFQNDDYVLYRYSATKDFEKMKIYVVEKKDKQKAHKELIMTVELSDENSSGVIAVYESGNGDYNVNWSNTDKTSMRLENGIALATDSSEVTQSFEEGKSKYKIVRNHIFPLYTAEISDDKNENDIKRSIAVKFE